MAREPRPSERPGGASAPSITRTSAVVAAYVARNALAARELPALIRAVHAAFVGMEAPPRADATAPNRPTSVEIAASLQDDHIVSFLDGKPYKTLKRHLTAHGLSPRGYRERYGLPPGYPVVAPSYAKRRAQLAKRMMDGRKAA